MKKIHADIKIYGIVQGVGFRPFVHKNIGNLLGNVRNTSFGALLELEGEECGIDAFLQKLSDSPPPLAYIEKIECEKTEKLSGYTRFSIVYTDFWNDCENSRKSFREFGIIEWFQRFSAIHA